MTAWGMPGPGGSMGKCFVCGENFIAGVLKDFCGYDSGITEFTIGCFDNTFYAHDPECVEAVKKAIDDRGTWKGQIVPDRLPLGPMRTELEKLLSEREQENVND